MSCPLKASNRNFLILLLLALVGTPSAYAQLLAGAIWQQPTAKVVQKATSFGATNTLTLAYPSNVKAGNILVVCISSDGDGEIADTQSNTWALAARTRLSATASCWYAAPAKGGATNVTISYGSGFIIMSILEISGMLTLDRAATATGSGTSISINTTATNSNNTYVIGYAHDWDRFSTWTAGAGFNMEIWADGNGTGYIAALEGKMSRGTGVKNVSFTKTPAGSWASIALVFKATPSVPRLVQHISASNTGTVTATFPSPVKAGSMLVACLTAEDGVTSLNDNLNGSYNGSGGFGRLNCAVKFNAAAGVTTVTLIPGAATYTSLAIFEVAGGLSTCASYETGANNGATAVTVISPSIAGPTGYFFAITGSYWGAAPVFGSYSLATPGWTIQERAGLSGGKYRFVYADKDQKNGFSSGTQTLTFNAADVTDFFGIYSNVCW